MLFTENARSHLDLEDSQRVFGHLNFIFRDIDDPAQATSEINHLLLAHEGTHASAERDTMRRRLREMFASVNVHCLRLPHQNLRNLGGTLPDDNSYDAGFLDNLACLRKTIYHQCSSPRVVGDRTLTIGLLHPLLVDVIEQMTKSKPFAPQDILEARDEHWANLFYQNRIGRLLTEIMELPDLEKQSRLTAEKSIHKIISDYLRQFAADCTEKHITSSVVATFSARMNSRAMATSASKIRGVLDTVAQKQMELEYEILAFLELASRDVPHANSATRGLCVIRLMMLATYYFFHWLN